MKSGASVPESLTSVVAHKLLSEMAMIAHGVASYCMCIHIYIPDCHFSLPAAQKNKTGDEGNVFSQNNKSASLRIWTLAHSDL